METSGNVIPNSRFDEGEVGELPVEWHAFSPYPYLMPHFQLSVKDGKRVLLAAGNGNEVGTGSLIANVKVTAGKTYRMWVRFRLSADLDPQRNLAFSFWHTKAPVFNDGIFRFRQLADGEIEGEGIFAVPGEGELEAEVRITFRLSAAGQAWIGEIGMEEREPLGERNARVACVSGQAEGDPDLWARVLERAAGGGADLVLLPEEFMGIEPETLDGPTATFMSEQARRHGMYVSATVTRRSGDDGHVYNTGLLYGRGGELVGQYDKIHISSPEYMELGIVPGREVNVFDTDFGKVGIMICYDSWFTDVAELLALRGAEIILFPNAGYYRSIMPARAADNGVRIVCSSGGNPYGIWDTTGADVEAPDIDPTRGASSEKTFRDVVTERVGPIGLLLATLDLNQSVSPANWGGPMVSAPGGRRNRREQRKLLLDDIRAETERWWSD